ncbi:MAG: hypothetical protein ACLQDM_04360 [Bradyrhizobium sp.]
MLGYFAELAAFVRELVERGRVLPQLRRDRHGAIASRRPVLQGHDALVLALRGLPRLIGSLVCRR